MAVKKKSWYAVRTGRHPGLYPTWAECQREVTGYPGAAFKGFYTREEAEAFLKGEEAAETAPVEASQMMTAYVDGSYAPFLPDRYAFGAVFLHEGKTETENRLFIDPENASMRNVAGEVAGARRAMEVCIERGIPQLELYYDYAGLEKWCTGEWKTNRPGTRALKAYYDSVRDRLTVHFHKVKSHTGVRYNEMADQLAKEALFGK